MVLSNLIDICQGFAMARTRSPRISVVVCTYRNPDLLRGAISSLLNQTLSSDQYEIIVVDNNSGDQTPEVVHCLGDTSSPPVSYVLETRQGLSHARNRGLEAARGEIVAFLDDDAEADPRWLAALLEAFDSDPRIWAAGGKILPTWHTDERPEWWSEEYEGWLSLVDRGDEPTALAWPERILGANCSFRHSVFSELGHFDPNLGRRGEALLGWEDTEIQQRIHARDKVVFYAPDAVVYHHVPPERLTKSYFLRRQFGSSRSQMVLLAKQEGKGAAFRRAAVDFLLLGWRLLQIGWIVLRHRTGVPFIHQRMVYHYWGHVVGFAESLLTRDSR